MKKNTTSFFIFLISSLLYSLSSFGQCVNANFENCDFTGWTGSTSKGPSGKTPSYSYPFRYPGLVIGPVNEPANGNPETSQVIMTSGNDVIVGAAIPVLFPDGGTCSARLGNQQHDGGGEVLSYKMLVSASNSLFTYNYAVVLDNSSNHDQWKTPYFRIRLWVYSGANNKDSTLVDCATYDVNPLTAPSIGGFVVVGKQGSNGAYEYKPWTSVTIPLQPYIGSTVAIQFITRDCSPQATFEGDPNGGTGGHYAYAYIDATCGPPTISSVPNCTNATLTAPAGAVSYKWAGPGIVSGGNTRVATVNVAGAYTATMTTSATGNCTYTVSINAVINPGLTVTVNSLSVCSGQAATLTASGASSYSWSNGATTNSITINPTSTKSYTVTGSSLGCTGTGIGTVYMLSAPTVVVDPRSICPGDSATLTASEATGYSWSTGSTANSITVTPASTSTYTVSGTGCPNKATPIVTVNPLPVITANSPTICVGATTTLTASGAGTGGDIYSWSTGSVMDTTTVSPTSTTSYTVTGISSLGCTGSGIGTVTVNPIPVVTVNSTTICAGQITALTASGANTYSWSTGTATNPISVSPASTTSYTVTGSSLGCSGTALSTVTVNISPNVAVNSPTICIGETATLTASGNSSTYSWSTGATTNSITVSPTSTTSYSVTGYNLGCFRTVTSTITVNPIPIVTVNTATICNGQGGPGTLTASGANTYAWSTGAITNSISDSPTSATTYTVTGNNLGCTGTGTGIIYVNPIPIVTVNSTTICAGQITTLTATGANTYSWSTGATINPISVSPASTTSYTVTGISLGCSGTALSTVTVNISPNVAVNSPTICIGETATLTASGNSSTYSWSTGATTNSITVSPTSTTSYSVTGYNLGCFRTVTSTITVNPIPIVTVNTATICNGQGGPGTLTASGANTYAWSTGAITNSISDSPTSTTTYTVTGNSLGCTGTGTGTIYVNPIPIVTVNSTTICAGETTTLTASGNSSTYLWSTGAATNSISVSPASTTVYTVTGSSLGCTQTAIGSVTVIPLPTAQFEPTPNPAKILDPVITFNNQSSSDVIYWFWNFGDGDTLAPNTPNPVHTYPGKEAKYLVTLVVHNSLCYGTVSHEVLIIPEFSFYIPNCFTPDGNGINDSFNGKGVGIIKYHLMIFDRWGNFIWETHSLNEDWDGSANTVADADTFGIAMNKDISQQDTYVWKVDLTDIFNKTHHYIGIVSLVKGDR